MSVEGLKPCPFCGSTSLMKAHGSAIYCNDCGAKGPDVPATERYRTGHPPVGEMKAAHWNRRHRERTPAEEAVLKAAIRVRAAGEVDCDGPGFLEVDAAIRAQDTAVDALLAAQPEWEP